MTPSEHLITDLLGCLECGSMLKEQKHNRDLLCPECGTVLTFNDGIYFSARGEVSETSAQTVASFGRRWNAVFKKMGALKDFFLESVQPVQKDLFKDKIIVDGGGGFGRLTKLMLDYGARHVVLLDASDAVFAAREYLSDYQDRVTLVKGSLLSPPLRPEAFDIFLCHGVLHHTGAPIRVLANIAKHLKPSSGITILWVYSKEGNKLLGRLISASRLVCSSIGDWGRWRVAALLDTFFWSLTNLVYRPLDKMLGIKSKLFYGEYFMDFLYVSENSNRTDRLQMYHDFLTTTIVEYYSRDELNEWLGNLGFKKISLHFYRKQSWSVAASFDPDENFSGK